MSKCSGIQVNDALVRVDAMVDLLMRKLQKKDLLHCVNKILLSDHGKALVSYRKAT